jgi:hypothetical protein
MTLQTLTKQYPPPSEWEWKCKDGALGLAGPHYGMFVSIEEGFTNIQFLAPDAMHTNPKTSVCLTIPTGVFEILSAQAHGRPTHAQLIQKCIDSEAESERDGLWQAAGRWKHIGKMIAGKLDGK